MSLLWVVTMNRPEWVIAKDAPAMLSRPRATVYRWVEQGHVRTMRPLHEMWLYVPDLMDMDVKTPRRRRSKKDSTCVS